MEATHLQASTDRLTGLLNRRSFENQAHDLIRRQVPFALAVADLDHFKALNDTHGHDAGDRALRMSSQILRTSLRADDLVCRYGGEEFVILFVRRSATEAAAALERVQEELLLTVAGGAMPHFTAGFGAPTQTTTRIWKSCAESLMLRCSEPSGREETASSSTELRPPPRSNPAIRRLSPPERFVDPFDL